MTNNDLRYITDVLKGSKPDCEPDYIAVCGFLQFHKAAGLFCSRANALGVHLPYKAARFLMDTYSMQKRKVQLYRNAIAEVSSALMRGRIEHVFLKGSVLSNAKIGNKEIYTDGERVSCDMDILVKPDGISAVSEVLREMGYMQGRYSALLNSIEPFLRSELLMSRMTRGETSPFLRITNNSEFPYTEVDINFSLGNTPDECGDLLTCIVNSARTYAGKITLNAPSPEMFFLHLIMHQYKESTLYFSVERGKDIDLYKFADIYYMWREGAYDKEKVRVIAEEYNVEDRLGAVLRQIAEIFRDEELLKETAKYRKAQLPVIDYGCKKKYVFTLPASERLLFADSARYLKEKEDA